jgi:hypothetical protein
MCFIFFTASLPHPSNQSPALKEEDGVVGEVVMGSEDAEAGSGDACLLPYS